MKNFFFLGNGVIFAFEISYFRPEVDRNSQKKRRRSYQINIKSRESRKKTTKVIKQ
jgi:hypothetical protein